MQLLSASEICCRAERRYPDGQLRPRPTAYEIFMRPLPSRDYCRISLCSESHSANFALQDSMSVNWSWVIGHGLRPHRLHSFSVKNCGRCYTVDQWSVFMFLPG